MVGLKIEATPPGEDGTPGTRVIVADREYKPRVGSPPPIDLIPEQPPVLVSATERTAARIMEAINAGLEELMTALEDGTITPAEALKIAVAMFGAAKRNATRMFKAGLKAGGKRGN